jgi:hypothetical protein
MEAGDVSDSAQTRSGFQGQGGARGIARGDDSTGTGGALRVQPNQIYAWKKALVEAAPKVFSEHMGRTDGLNERKLAELYEQLGRVMVERDFLLRRSAL